MVLPRPSCSVPAARPGQHSGTRRTSSCAKLIARLTRAYEDVRIGSPLDPVTLMGPLVTRGAVADLQNAIERVKAEGGKILYGGEPQRRRVPGRSLRETLHRAKNDFSIVQEETFARSCTSSGTDRRTPRRARPSRNTTTTSGLSFAIFTDSTRGRVLSLSQGKRLRDREREHRRRRGGGWSRMKGGRESGSDSWKAYMRGQRPTP